MTKWKMRLAPWTSVSYFVMYGMSWAWPQGLIWVQSWAGKCIRLKNVIVLVTQSCLTLFDSMDCSPPGSSVHGILQARVLEWVAMPSSRVSSWPRDQTPVSHIVGRFFTIWATREDSSDSGRLFQFILLSNEQISSAETKKITDKKRMCATVRCHISPLVF